MSTKKLSKHRSISSIVLALGTKLYGTGTNIHFLDFFFNSVIQGFRNIHKYLLKCTYNFKLRVFQIRVFFLIVHCGISTLNENLGQRGNFYGSDMNHLEVGIWVVRLVS